MGELTVVWVSAARPRIVADNQLTRNLPPVLLPHPPRSTCNPLPRSLTSCHHLPSPQHNPHLPLHLPTHILAVHMRGMRHLIARAGHIAQLILLAIRLAHLCAGGRKLGGMVCTCAMRLVVSVRWCRGGSFES